MKPAPRMEPEQELMGTEQLLGAELDRLQNYNRLLEKGMPMWLTDAVTKYRNEQIQRIASLQDHIRSCRAALEVGL